jgi:hypothetical protein
VSTNDSFNTQVVLELSLGELKVALFIYIPNCYNTINYKYPHAYSPQQAK